MITTLFLVPLKKSYNYFRHNEKTLCILVKRLFNFYLRLGVVLTVVRIILHTEISSDRTKMG